MNQGLLMAIGLMLVLEGVLPFMAPQKWRQAFRRLTEFSDGQLRFMGLASMLGGLIIIFIVNNT